MVAMGGLNVVVHIVLPDDFARFGVERPGIAESTPDGDIGGEVSDMKLVSQLPRMKDIDLGLLAPEHDFLDLRLHVHFRQALTFAAWIPISFALVRPNDVAGFAAVAINDPAQSTIIALVIVVLMT